MHLWEEHPDVVVNFAAESHVDRSIENPAIFLETNIIGTAVLMDACRKYGIEQFHQVGTNEVYGDLPLTAPICFSMKIRRFILQVLTAPRKPQPIFLFRHITERMVFQ